MSGSGRAGVALAAVLLSLAAMSTLAMGMAMLVAYDIRLASNRLELAEARALERTNMTIALLELEAAGSGGELPARTPDLPGLVAYRRIDPLHATLGVEGRVGSSRQLGEARIELRREGGTWRVFVLERR